jgi:RNA polymerase sigma-70 factor (ECF subfamily)
MVRLADAADDSLQALLPAVLDGDARAIARLLAAIGPRVLRVVRQVLGSTHPEVEDVVQEAVFGVMEALPEFRGECRVTYFASRVALLTAMNARRRLGLRERLTSSAAHEDFDELPTGELSPAAALRAARRRRVVAELMAELPAGQAEALAMHCVLGYTIDETAEACGAPANTVRGRLLTAKAALRKRLDEDPELRDEVLDSERGAS